MARKYRLEYLKRKKKREREKMQRSLAALQEQSAKETNATKEDSVKSTLKEFVGWIAYLAVIVLATYLVVTYVGQRTRVSGDSMEPSLHNGDNLIVDKISYRFRDPERYDIIVFPYKYQEGVFYIKRIIGLPGETVQIIDGEVYINGELLGETYGIEPIERGKEGFAGEPIKLGEDQYFVLGDNRNHSADSRESGVGLLKKSDLVGRAWIRIWPLDNIGVISHE